MKENEKNNLPTEPEKENPPIDNYPPIITGTTVIICK
jgi:hypothetical protein